MWAPGNNATRALCGTIDLREGVIEAELTQFIQASIRSVWTLELLLRLRREPERSWSAGELIREMRASESIVADGLRHLQLAGLVAPEPHEQFRYAPASASLEALVQQLDELYRQRPGTVTQAIFAPPNEKLRRFADAFRLKKD